MRRYTDARHAIIDYLGLHGAMPALEKESGAPALLRPGDDESRLRRVAWPEFFAACESRGLGLLYDDAPESFDGRLVPTAQGRKEGGRRRSVVEFLKALPVVGH